MAKGEEVGGINPPQPAAANMRKMVWSEELELIAQRWADQCTFGHDSVRTKLDGTQVGQNKTYNNALNNNTHLAEEYIIENIV